MSSTPSNTTTTSISEPPEFLVPYIQDHVSDAMDLAQDPYTAYTGDMIAGFDPAHTTGMEMVTDRATSGSPYMDAAQALGLEAMKGEVNPYVNDIIAQNAQNMTEAYNDITNPYFTSQDVASGSFGNSGLQQARMNSVSDLTQNIGEMANTARYGAWNDAQGRAMQAASAAPMFAEADYMDADKMMGVGDMVRDYEQSLLNKDYGDWQSEMMWPYQQLDLRANAIKTGMAGGGSVTTSAPNAYATNPYANILGGGLMLSSVPGLLGL